MELSKAVRGTPLVDGGGGLEDWPGSLGGGGGGGGGGGAGETPEVGGGVGEDGVVGGELAPEPELLLYFTVRSSSFS